MLKIAKIEKINNTKFHFTVDKIYTSNYDKGNNKNIDSEKDVLSFYIECDEFNLLFMLKYDLDFYKNMVKYENIVVDKNDIVEVCLSTDEYGDVNVTLNLNLVRVGDTITLSGDFISEDYYGQLEYDFNIKELP